MSAPQYFAEINNENIVVYVSVVTKLFMEENPDRYPGTWVETFIDAPNKTYAGIGYTYDPKTKNFTAPPVEPIAWNGVTCSATACSLQSSCGDALHAVMTEATATHAKTTTTGRSQNANHHSATRPEHALEIWFMRPRLKPEELHARLIVIVGIILAGVFAITVLGFVYALMFVTQPIGHQSPNDSAFIDLLSTLTVFMTGTLSGLVASNGLKSKPKEPTHET
jgi:hypothetical protein